MKTESPLKAPFEMFPLLNNLRRYFRQCEVRPEIQPQISGFLEKSANLEIEIGCGKGKFLVAEAENRPEVRFIGIDRVGKWMKRGIKRAEKNGLANILFLKADALAVLKQCIPAGTVDAFHIYFPDPWPKRRHEKRRLLTAEFFALLYTRLNNDGRIFLATDHEKYLTAIKEEIRIGALPWQRRESKNQRLTLASGAKTNYELKYEAAGKDLYYLELRK